MSLGAGTAYTIGSDGKHGSAPVASAVDLAIAMQQDRAMMLDALRARDSALGLLVEACHRIREKTNAIQILEAFNTELEIRINTAGLQALCLDPGSNEGRCLAYNVAAEPQIDERPVLPTLAHSTHPSFDTFCSSASGSARSRVSSVTTAYDAEPAAFSITPVNHSSPMEARLHALSSLPLPDMDLEAVLPPFHLPPNMDLVAVLKMAPDDVQETLGHFMLLEEETTLWCTEREEHGCQLLPLFTCLTKPHVVTAHSWTQNNVLDALERSIHCFYRKGQNYYYAGLYSRTRLSDIEPAEWLKLSYPTKQNLIKATLAGRRGVSPANTYEVSQLYDIGALKVASVGLQCVAFNEKLSQAILSFTKSHQVVHRDPGHRSRELYQQSQLCVAHAQYSESQGFRPFSAMNCKHSI